MSEFRSDVLDLSDLTDRKILLRPSNLLSRILQRLRWFFASGTRLIALLLLVVGLPGVIPGQLGSVFPSGLVRFHTAISAELVGMALAVLLIDTANELRSEREQKEALILQMGSPDNGFAVEAVRQLRARDWLTDGSLQEAWLRSANLQGAALEHANLQRTLLSCANLQGAKLWSANLQGAKLWSTNLRGAHLERANLQGAALPQANLQGASLIEVDLQGANLGSVNLQGANLWGANLQGAVLMEADLQETHLGSTNLQGANLWGTNLQGAANAKIEQIRQPASLEGATLPDGTKLPDNDSWHEVFEAWCETVQLDDYGYIVPAPPED